MGTKTLKFDATEVKISTKTVNYIAVEIETDYSNEVLNNFTVEEIIQEYENIDELFDELTKRYK